MALTDCLDGIFADDFEGSGKKKKKKKKKAKKPAPVAAPVPFNPFPDDSALVTSSPAVALRHDVTGRAQYRPANLPPAQVDAAVAAELAAMTAEESADFADESFARGELVDQVDPEVEAELAQLDADQGDGAFGDDDDAEGSGCECQEAPRTRRDAQERTRRPNAARRRIVSITRDGRLLDQVLGSGAIFPGTPTPTAADPAKVLQGEAWQLVETILSNLNPSQPALVQQYMERLRTMPEVEMREKLAEYIGYLRKQLDTPLPSGLSDQGFYAWLQNQFNDVQFQRRHIASWAAAIAARGFTPPDPVELGKLDERAAQDMEAVNKSLVSTAKRLGFKEGVEFQKDLDWVEKLFGTLDRILRALAELAGKVADVVKDTGAGFGLGLLAAVLLGAAALSRRR